MDVFKPDLFAGKVCVITGGSRGGMLFETARAIANKGAKVAMLARNLEKLEEACALLREESGQDILPVKVNVRSKADCERAVGDVMSAFGRIDFLINGAAGNFLVQAEALSENGMKAVLEIDTLGTFLMSQAVFLGAFKE